MLIFNFRGKKMSGRIIKQNVINSAHLVAHSSIRLLLLLIYVIRSMFLKLQVTKTSNTPLGTCGRCTLISWSRFHTQMIIWALNCPYSLISILMFFIHMIWYVSNRMGWLYCSYSIVGARKWGVESLNKIWSIMLIYLPIHLLDCFYW